MTIASHQPRIRADIVLDVLARQERNQAYLARKMGVSRSYLTRLLNGERPATPAVRARLCQALNLPDVVLFSTMPMHIDTAPVEAAS
jgi:transcriptional regulator with XRE-family HTH domain